MDLRRGRFSITGAGWPSLNQPQFRLWGIVGLAAAVVVCLVVLGGASSHGPNRATGSSNVASPTVTPQPTAAVACPTGQCPKQGPPTGNPILDNIWYGAIPPNSSNTPVLVFVHGISGIAQDWWSATSYSGTNDMYLYAYTAGYRTAFVTLNSNGQRGPGNTMWVNGQTLTQQIQYIAQYYGVSQVDLVTHSKGGVDAQTAIVYDGAAPYVNQVFMLSSPNEGSPIAVIGCAMPNQTDAATCSMTSSYMQVYRALTDKRDQGSPVKYWVSGGTYIGPTHSIYYDGGLLMQLGHITSDGFVPITSSMGLPNTPELFIRPYDHDSVRVGHNAFPWIQSILTGGGVNGGIGSSSAATLAKAAASVPSTAPSIGLPASPDDGSLILRGGVLNGDTSATVPIEAGASAVHFALLTSDRSVNASLLAPNGQEQALSSQVTVSDEMFAGQWYRSYDAANPAAGTWTLKVSGPPGSSYYLVTAVASPLQVSLSGIPDVSAQLGQVLTPKVTAKDGSGNATVTTVTHQITTMSGGLAKSVFAVPAVTGSIQSPSQPDLMEITITVSGKTSGGSPFERTFVRSVPVVNDGSQLSSIKVAGP